MVTVSKFEEEKVPFDPNGAPMVSSQAVRDRKTGNERYWRIMMTAFGGPAVALWRPKTWQAASSIELFLRSLTAPVLAAMYFAELEKTVIQVETLAEAKPFVEYYLRVGERQQHILIVDGRHRQCSAGLHPGGRGRQ